MTEFALMVLLGCAAVAAVLLLPEVVRWVLRRSNERRP